MTSIAQVPQMTVSVSGQVMVQGTTIPVPQYMVKLTAYATDSTGGYLNIDTYTDENGYYSINATLEGSEGIATLETMVCNNQIETLTFNIVGDTINYFSHDFYVCDITYECQALYSYYPTNDPLTYQFENQSTGENLSYYWDFGDNTYSYDENPIKTFGSVALYIVSLTIVNPDSSCYNSFVNWVYTGDTMSACKAYFESYQNPGAGNLTVGFQDFSTGNITDWHWHFGDGTIDSTQNPIHVYPVPGTYEVCLTVTSEDNTCFDTYCTFVEVDGNGCHAFFETSQDPSAGDLTVNFQDLSSGAANFWFWDFGDGTTDTVQNPVHTYAIPSIYQVCLTLTSPDSTCFDVYCKNVDVTGNVDCLAHFSYYSSDTSNGNVGVQFMDFSQGNVTNWNWDFGDGTTSTEQNPFHVYPPLGSYQVCLTISGPDCQSTWCDFIKINDSIPPCSNYFTYMNAGNSVEFTGWLNSGEAATYDWNFGDGFSATGNPILHEYPGPGIYYVTLITTTEDQCVSVFTQDIVVGDSIAYNQVYGQVLEGNWPLTEGFVMIFSAEVNPNSYSYFSIAPVDTSGVYVFPMVPYGNYNILAIPADGSNYLPTYYESTQFWQEATIVTAGQTPNPVNISLISADQYSFLGICSISGTISTGSLKSGYLGEIVVYLTDQDHNIISFTKLGSSGTFSFENLAYGTYYIKPELPGVYSEFLRVDLTSSSFATVNMTLNGNSILGDEEIHSDEDLSIYPNPAHESVRVIFKNENNGTALLTLSDLSGRIITQKTLNISGGTAKIDIQLNTLEPGIYLIKLQLLDGTGITRKLIRN